ncbi:NAD-dependent epimerase/dehydratase family protein [candidate division KSB1 bacterium]|nr:NAD-dependent epimerase/dehydratase family protein [candidate division KSB1 bacterium]
MRIIITGASGQVGRALQQVLSEQGLNVLPTPRFDVADHAIVPQLSALSPELVIHCAAMTNVDGCATDPDTAFKVNAFGAIHRTAAAERDDQINRGIFAGELRPAFDML